MKIAESKEGNQILLGENGTPKNCPFQPVQFLPGKVHGQIIEHQKPCGNWCPFFELLEEVEGQQSVRIECTGLIHIYKITEVIKNKSNLQSL